MSNGFKIGDSIFKNRIEFYPPDKKIETYVAQTHDFLNTNTPKFLINIEYKDMFSKEFSEKAILDLNHHKKQGYIKESKLKDVVNSLDKIKSEIKKLKS